MGTDNRQRRAAKARKRAGRASAMGARPGPPRDDSRLYTPECDCLHCRFDVDPRAALDHAANMLVTTVALMWHHGWQPSELVRQVRRALSRDAADLVAAAVLVDDRRRGDQVKHLRWQGQIDALAVGASVDWSSGDARSNRWMHVWVDAASDGRTGGGGVVEVIDALMSELTSLGALPRLLPPPGETECDAVGVLLADDTDDPVLARVRALLAQAESTTFPAEAEVFTAKAQAMMSRHAIDEAMVRHAAGNRDRPITVRLPIDVPYAAEQAVLLHVVADAGRCRSISMSNYAMSTLIGAATDVRRVEILFTSLLLQAQAALNHEAASGGAGSHRRSRRFRAGFLAGYASRIGDRLHEERERAESDAGAEVLPVLARQSQAVDDELDRLFSDRITRGGSKARDLAGWDAGTDAADRARLRDGGLDPVASRTELTG